jgi:hypothetical protein
MVNPEVVCHPSMAKTTVMHAVIIFVLQGCLASSDLQAAFGVLKCTPSISFIYLVPFINQIEQRIYDQNLQDQNSKIRECEKLSFLRNIYDENERAAYVESLEEMT